MARDVMAVRLHLPQIRVLEVLEDTPGALVVSVESTFSCGCAVRSAGSSATGCMTAAPRRSATWRCRDGAPCWCGRGAGWCATTATAASWRTIPRSRAR